MEVLKPNEQRAKNAILLIWIVLALEILAILSGYLLYDLIQTAINGGEISEESANSNDLREQVIAILYLIAYVISVVTFILWFRRAYFNLHLKVKHLSHPEGWAAGSWFVPFTNLYRPYKIMKELYQETKALLVKKEIFFKGDLATSTLGWWWAFWLLNSFAGQIVFRYSLNAESLEELNTTTVLSIFSNIIGIPLALLAIKVIKDYANVESLLHEVKDEPETTNM
ncbi:MAG: DUF4328 domain-containing protein [Cytophagales bacterium]|nr:DUF4328 domain-containing protein [Cytophagales bacterium]